MKEPPASNRRFFYVFNRIKRLIRPGLLTGLSPAAIPVTIEELQKSIGTCGGSRCAPRIACLSCSIITASTTLKQVLHVVCISREVHRWWEDVQRSREVEVTRPLARGNLGGSERASRARYLTASNAQEGVYQALMVM